jgi:hypothetical protein
MLISNHLSYAMEGYIDIQNNTMTEYCIMTQLDRDEPIKLDQKLMTNNTIRLPIKGNDMSIDLTENDTNQRPNIRIVTAFTDNNKRISIAVDQSFESPYHAIPIFEEIARKMFDITKNYPNILIRIEEEAKDFIFKKASIISQKRAVKKQIRKDKKVEANNKKILYFLSSTAHYKIDLQYLISLQRK